jgi:hypothetical protein
LSREKINFFSSWSPCGSVLPGCRVGTQAARSRQSAFLEDVLPPVQGSEMCTWAEHRLGQLIAADGIRPFDP